MKKKEKARKRKNETGKYREAGVVAGDMQPLLLCNKTIIISHVASYIVSVRHIRNLSHINDSHNEYIVHNE